MPHPSLISLVLSAVYAAIYVLAGDFHGWELKLLLISVLLGAILVALSTIDALTFRLPDPLNLALFSLGLLVTALTSAESVVWNLAAAVFGFLLLVAVARVYQHFRGQSGLGLGDAKLFGGAGMWLGFEGLSSVLFVACASALIVVTITLASGRRVDGSTPIPFGPFLCLGIWTTWNCGPVL